MAERLPNLLVIGAMKCATSSICSFFERHPDVFFVKGGEPNFFSMNERWSEGLEAYTQHFSGAEAHKMVGEGSNSYSDIDTYPETPERIHDVIPGAKLVYSVRHPIERVASAWAQYRSQSPDIISHDINIAVREHAEIMINPSFYWRQLSAYLDYFPRDQIWIGFLTELYSDPEKFYADLCGFCGLAPFDSERRGEAWKNKTEGRKILGETYTRVRRVPGINIVRRFAPDGLKSRIKDKLSVKTPSTAETVAALDLPKETLAALKSDTQQFLAYLNKPQDYWEF